MEESKNSLWESNHLVSELFQSSLHSSQRINTPDEIINSPGARKDAYNGPFIDVAETIDETEAVPVYDLNDKIEQKLKVKLEYDYEKNSSWNKEFQQIVNMPMDTTAQRLERVTQFRKLSISFCDIASKIGKTIIEEKILPLDQKSIKPVSIGGVAGGEKYIYEGIFFKFSIDLLDLYGSDEFAMKAAGHEMSGANAYLSTILSKQVTNLAVPLMCLIDYRGFRLLAQAVVPVKGTETLVYGSADGGNTVMFNQILNEQLEKAANIMNLKGHFVGSGEQKKFLYGPGDLEGHLDPITNRFYLLDTARLFPPEAKMKTTLFIPFDNQKPIEEINLSVDDKQAFDNELRVHLGTYNSEITPVGRIYFSSKVNKRNSRAEIIVKKKINGNAILLRSTRSAFLHRLLRSELVKTNEVALSSDAFTGFASPDDPDRISNMHEVSKATQRLIKIVIPSFAHELNSHRVNPVDHKELIDLMHKTGINVRYLGLLRAWISIPHLRSFILTEMCTRVMKNTLRKYMRENESTNEDSFRQIGLKYFNLILSSSNPNSHDYWSVELKTMLQVKFPSALSEKERDVNFDLREEILLFPLFMRLQEVTGFLFKAGAQKNLFEYPLFFDKESPLTWGDIDCIKVLINKNMVRDSELMACIVESVDQEEKKSSNLMKQLDDKEFRYTFRVLFHLRRHRRIEKLLGTDSKEAISSYFTLASFYSAIGNYSLALESALRGLSYGEVLFGAYSEETLMGLVTVGEIMEKVGTQSSRQQAVEFFKRALTAVDRLYRLHPLKGKLCCKLHFLISSLDPDKPEELYLQQGFEAYSSMYGEETAYLVVPLMALEHNNIDFVLNIQSQTERDSNKNLISLSQSFWPNEMLEMVKVNKAQKDTVSLIEQLKTKTAYHLLFEESEQETMSRLLQLSPGEIEKIGINSGVFPKIHANWNKHEKATLVKEVENIPPFCEPSKWRIHSLHFLDFAIVHMKLRKFIHGDVYAMKDISSINPEHIARLIHRLNFFHLKESSTPNYTSDSQYFALSNQLFKPPFKLADLRKQIANWLSQNKHYMLKATPICDLISKISWEEYVNKKLNGGSGDCLTLLAVAEIYCVQIVVLSSLDKDKFLTEISPKSRKPSKCLILSFCVEGSYWSSLEPIPQPRNYVEELNYSSSSNPVVLKIQSPSETNSGYSDVVEVNAVQSSKEPEVKKDQKQESDSSQVIPIPQPLLDFEENQSAIHPDQENAYTDDIQISLQSFSENHNSTTSLSSEVSMIETSNSSNYLNSYSQISLDTEEIKEKETLNNEEESKPKKRRGKFGGLRISQFTGHSSDNTGRNDPKDSKKFNQF